MGNGNIGFVLLIGLPASGKTTFAQLLEKSLKTSNTVSHQEQIPSSFVVNICYDKVLQWPTQIEEGSAKWCEERKRVFTLVEKLVSLLKTGYGDVGEMKDLNLLVHYSEFQKYHERTIIIIDDNMYYRSMRYQYFQLARLWNLGFSQVFIDCDLEEVLQRNAARSKDDFVPEEVIKRMKSNLEPPDKVSHSWEQYSYCISSSKPICSTVLCDVLLMIQNSILDPVPPIRDPSEAAKMARTTCLVNVIHQVDLTLRKIIGQKMSNQQNALNKVQIKNLAKDLQIKKRLILKHVTEGTVQIPEEICANIESCSSNASLLLYQFLQQQFNTSDD
ncbi:L-seryl-tRNA(Sec) kinase [Anabrus simplex]|uniref:L-seryl-tRNA(Sec) kinase n=1 Tax=Anabrus simplex TaxID=316456 RepID=UPI0035A37F46